MEKGLYKIAVLFLDQECEPTAKNISMFGEYEISGDWSHKDIDEFVRQLELEHKRILEWVWIDRNIHKVTKSSKPFYIIEP